MFQESKIINASVLDELRRYPTVELVKRLFPDVKMHGRSLMCNPLRGEKHASLSCFRDRSGFQRWKDHATGETGDNIDFYRLANPGMGYVESVEALSVMLLGRSAFDEVASARVAASQVIPPRTGLLHRPLVEEPGSIRVMGLVPYAPSEDPYVAGVVEYTRSRGISDDVAGRYLNIVSFQNINRIGRSVIDRTSGLPVIGEDGEIVRDNGANLGIGMLNDIGGYTLRVPDGTDGSKGFKCSDTVFISTILSNGARPYRNVRTFGIQRGSAKVEKMHYDESAQMLFINGLQGFSGVTRWAASFAMPFLSKWSGRYLEGKDFRSVLSMLDTLDGPVHRKVTVVEGMFDGLSVIEFEKMNGRAPLPDGDLVILNSVSNLQWAVPFLAMHGEVISLLDNDMSSKAGQKTFSQLEEKVGAYAAELGVGCFIRSESSRFYPEKDLNDYLKTVKGLKRPVELVSQTQSVSPAPAARMAAKPSRKPAAGKEKAKGIPFKPF